MSKRKFDEAFDKQQASSSLREPSKYSLDSDEEDDEDTTENNVLADEDIEGQEEGTVGMNDGIKITPFNMKEEMEEGHFDADGMYHWKKESNIKDNWLDNIDWETVREADKPDKSNDADLPMYSSSDDSNEDSADPRFDTITAYKKMLEYMQPEETVTQALCRLGKKKEISRAERYKQKAAGQSDDEKVNLDKFYKLTELADEVLNRAGNVNIYGESYEDMCYEICSWEMRRAEDSVTSQSDNLDLGEPEGLRTPKREELDMYADDFAKREQKRLKYSTGTNANADSDTELREKEPNEPTSAAAAKTMWEYKATKDSDIINGPHDSKYMKDMVASTDFEGEIWVRKSNSFGEFYPSKRIDFSLYL